MKEIVLFFLRFAAAELILTAIQYSLRKKEIRPLYRVLIIVGKLLLAVAFAALVMAGPFALRPVQPIMTAFYAVLFSDAAADIVYSFICLTSRRERKLWISRIVSVVFGVAFCIYGVVNMQTVLPKFHEYTSEKLAEDHRIVFIADLHVDGAQSFDVTKKTADDVRGLEPDCVILGGDIIDDFSTKQEMLDTCALFSGFPCPVYYVYGNHDRQTHAATADGVQYSPEELESAMKNAGIEILRDEFAVVAPDLVILGREDLNYPEDRADAATLKSPQPDAYLVVADHQPTDVKGNLATGMDLQLSGHTHAGQFFPLGEILSLFTYSAGDYEVGGAIMNVSAGACGWRLPFRTDSHCYYEVVDLRPAPSSP